MNAFNAGVSSETNDPNTAHMRVFVGNLNTNNITKPTLQNIFGKYGSIAAISIHRGFAFIQYNNPYTARSAVQGEQGSVIAGQTIDINISSEPKPNQKSKAQQPATTFAGAANPAAGFEGGWNPPPKRGRGARGGVRGAVAGVVRGARGRGVVIRGRGRGRGVPPNKVQSGRVEKAQVKKKPMLPPLASRNVPVESPVIGTVTSPVKGTITAATGPDGTQTIDLAALKAELTEVRDKITQLLEFFPANLTVGEDHKNGEPEAGSAVKNEAGSFQTT